MSIRKSTYSFGDYRDNLIVDFDAPVLRWREESGWRLGQENSADALAWNVFRTLDLFGAIHATWRKCIELSEAPRILYWGRSRDNEVHRGFAQTIARLEGNADGASELYEEPDLVLVDAAGANIYFVDSDVVALLGDKSARLPRSMSPYHEGDTAFRGGFARVAREGFFSLARKLVIVRAIAALSERRGKLVSVVNPATQPRAREELRAFRSALTPEGVDAHEVVTWADLYAAMPERARIETRGVRMSLAEYFTRKTINRQPAMLIESR